jgi:outer membrane immunogenic protein
MLSKRLATALTLVAGIMAVPAFAQEDTSRQEISVQGLGAFVKTTTSNGVKQSATDSGGFLANYRYFFTSNQGLEVNYGYALNTQEYGLSTGTADIKSYSHEATAAYVFRYPMKRFSLFGLAGGGAIAFTPKNVTAADWQARPAFVYGGGVDYSLSRHLFLRAEYRGLVYNSPTFAMSELKSLDRVTHRAEPSAGIGWRF